MKRTFPKIFFSILFMGASFFSGYGQMNVMTYNIKYANEKDGENSWSNRKNNLRDLLRYYEPDIFGVQEALKSQLDFIKMGLADYDYSGVGRDDDTKGEHCAVFYNINEYENLKEGTFWLSKTPEKVSKGWDAAYKRICTYIQFKDLKTGKKFWVFNTHFDHVGVKARKKSVQLIMNKIEEINYDGLPFILMGDFNLEPDSAEIGLLSEYFNDSKMAAKLTFGPEGTFNGYSFMEPVTRRIDYIFTSKGDIDVLKYGVLSDSKDLKYPSDHFPVLVSIKF